MNDIKKERKKRTKIIIVVQKYVVLRSTMINFVCKKNVRKMCICAKKKFKEKNNLLDSDSLFEQMKKKNTTRVH